ncbi:MAG: hypothetical protein ACR2J6_07225 [Thermoleophilaceae bacterium]
MMARLLAAAACGTALALSACGGSDSPAKSPASGQPPDPNDKRAVAVACLRDDKQLPVRVAGDKSIQVGGRRGPRVEFFVSSGEAEGRQFDGDAQGAEQIGAALLYINRGSEDQLKLVEECLDDQ